jgi:hypothetical protein
MNIDMTDTKYQNEWQVFMEKINTYANDTPIEKWNAYTLLSYFLMRYKDKNGIEFIFSACKKGPTQSRELKQAVKIWIMFDKNRYKQLETKEEKLTYKEQLVSVLKDYIDWAFNVKFYGRQTNVTGLGIFAVPNFMNEFLQYRRSLKSSTCKRGSLLPPDFVSWIRDNLPEIWNKQQLEILNDLNILHDYVIAYDAELVSIEAKVLEKAREFGIMPIHGKMELK